MKFPKQKFIQFCNRLIIDSKERGLVPLHLNGAQKYLIDQICEGLSKDIHKFVVLKGRQFGCSTVMLALDLFWQFYFPGMQGAVICDKEKTRDQFKSTLEGYLLGLPHEWKIPVRQHNRNQFVLQNRSRVAYMVAGGRQSGALARGAGLNFLHGTECSSWSDDEGLASLNASLAEKHPHRLYVFESTARGFNMFYDMWTDATRARTTKAIFIGWWLKEDYALDKDSEIFQVYWDGRIAPDERKWVKEVKSLYGYDIKPEQLAWWRWKLNEEIHDEKLMMQEFPPTEQYAFILSGEQFFSTTTLLAIKKEIDASPAPATFSYEIGPEFQNTTLHASRDGELTVWEEPVDGAYYTIGADPAYGASETSDSFVIQVLRCYADGCEQVAEYASRQGTMYGFAWILAHLAGAYRNVHIVLEITGPGQGVWQELCTLPAKLSTLDKKDAPVGQLLNIFGNISHYIYRRPDSLGGGGGFWHWQTTATNKQWVMHGLRDTVERKMLKVRSIEWVEEARYITQEGSHIAGAGRSKDDRIMAMALAVEGWIRAIEPLLRAQGRTRKMSADTPPITVGGQLVERYLENIMSGKRPN